MTNKFKEIITYFGLGDRRNYEVQVGTYSESDHDYVVYYYLYGTAVDRTYHSNVKSAIETAQDFINGNDNAKKLDNKPRAGR